MSTTHITPTPGRIVWYRGADGDIRPAIVIQGNGPFNADLYVFPKHGADVEHGNVAKVTHADPEQEPTCYPSWHWMPYQKAQAEKAEERKSAALSQSAGQIVGAGDESYLRAQMALHTPGLTGQQEVIDAASAYLEFVKTGGLGITTT